MSYGQACMLRKIYSLQMIFQKNIVLHFYFICIIVKIASLFVTSGGWLLPDFDQNGAFPGTLLLKYFPLSLMPILGLTLFCASLVYPYVAMLVVLAHDVTC